MKDVAPSDYHVTNKNWEFARLQALDGLKIIDTPPEPYYDKITRSVANRFDAPIALVSLVAQDKLFFKSSFGTDVREVPRASTFCTVAINDQEVFVVPDALKQARFGGCPVVANPPFARFYAGAPIRISTGVVLGTVCFVYDYPYENFSNSDAEFLRDMADMASHYIELRWTREQIDPMNMLPLASLAVTAIIDATQIKKTSVSAFAIELFGSIRTSEFFIILGEERLLELINLKKKIILDILPESAHMFSLGIDRFLCILSGVDRKTAIILELEIGKALSSIVRIANIPIRNIPRVGLARQEKPGLPPNALIRMSIAAMEQARDTHSHCAVYSRGQENKLRRKLDIVHQLPTAFKNNEITINYQPKIELSSNDIVGAEALVRWKNSKLGSVSPSEFIPIMEETGTICELLDWLIENVALDLE